MVNKSNILFTIWWLNVAVQSIVEMGWVFVIVFFATTIALIISDIKNSIILLLGSFFVPYTSTFLPSPYFIICVFSCVIFLVKHNFRCTFKLSGGHLTIYAFFLFSIFHSLIFFPLSLTSEVVNIYSVGLITFWLLGNLFDEVKTEDDLFLIIKRILIISVMTFFLSIIHYYGGESTNHHIASITDDSFGMKLYIDSSMSVKRVLWAGVDPNFFASAFMFIFTMSFYFAQKNKAYFLVSFSCLLSVLGSMSRTGFILLLLSFFLTIFLKKNRMKVKMLLFSLFLIAGILYFMPVFLDRIMSISGNLIESGGTGRFDRFENAILVWADHVWGTGLGPNSSIGYYGNGAHAHNTYLQILVDSGVIGLFLFLVGICLLLYPDYGRVSYFQKVALIGIVCTLLFYFTLPNSDFRFLFLIIFLYRSHSKVINSTYRLGERNGT